MKVSPHATVFDAFSIGEIARAGHVSMAEVHAAIAEAQVRCQNGFVPSPAAVRLVRGLRQAQPAPVRQVAASTASHRHRLSLVCSGTLHALLIGALISANWLGLLRADQTTVNVPHPDHAHLVFLTSPGVGGGGGGGGLLMPKPPARAQVHAAVVKKISSAVPPARRAIPPPPVVRPAPLPIVAPAPTPMVPQVIAPEPRPAPMAIQAPLLPVAADPVDSPGIPSAPAGLLASLGPGTGGGAGSGTGLGEGHGPGVGDGSGGGAGGGPYQPGADIDPPTLLREVRPDYTADARKRAIEGDVALEIIVKRDGTVGTIRVLHTLAGGLEQKAVDAVRQWRFAPATRRGAPVDVVVTVSVGFKLR
jgi:TonB family protein